MRANEIIRSIIDLIDQIDHGGQPSVSIAINSTPIEPLMPEPAAVMIAGPEHEEHDDFQDSIRRFKQIAGVLSGDDTSGQMSPFSNAPDEKYLDVDSVTSDAGGGVNGPKHPADIKGNSLSIYPDFVAKRGE